VRKPCIAAIHMYPTQPLRLPHRLPPRLLLSLPLHVSRHRRRLHGAPAGPLPLALPPPHVARPRLPVHVGPAPAVHLVYERCPLIQAEPPLRLRRVEERPAYDGRLCTRSPRVLQRQLRMGRVRRVLEPPFRRLRRDVVRRYRRNPGSIPTEATAAVARPSLTGSTALHTAVYTETYESLWNHNEIKCSRRECAGTQDAYLWQ
jgi:hypothetical protein